MDGFLRVTGSSLIKAYSEILEHFHVDIKNKILRLEPSIVKCHLKRVLVWFLGGTSSPLLPAGLCSPLNIPLILLVLRLC